MLRHPQTSPTTFLVAHRDEAIEVIQNKLTSSLPNIHINSIRFGDYTDTYGTTPNCLIVSLSNGMELYYSATSYPSRDDFMRSFNADFAFIWLSESKLHGYQWPQASTSLSRNILAFTHFPGDYLPFTLRLTDYFDPSTGVIQLKALFDQLNARGLMFKVGDQPIRTRGAVFASVTESAPQETTAIDETTTFPGAITSADFEATAPSLHH